MSIRLRIAAALAVALLAVLAGFSSAAAQSCPGGFLQVRNTTGCALVVKLIAVPPIAPIAVGPGATVGVAVAPGTVIQKVRSNGGIDYAFPPIPPEPACVGPITMAVGCCAKVCLYPHNCIIEIKPAPAPCAP